MMMSFRPLDGESFSKLHLRSTMIVIIFRFRPLDGESFSKLERLSHYNVEDSFRPLDGESFSKQCIRFYY